MNAINAESGGRFYRDRDRAILGGVCAGLADYLGFNLKVTRILAFIAFLTMMPITIIAYLAAVFLIPSVSRSDYDAAIVRSCCGRRRRQKKQARESAGRPESSVADVINERCALLDVRLKDLEKHVTSKRYQLDQELSRL